LTPSSLIPLVFNFAGSHEGVPAFATATKGIDKGIARQAIQRKIIWLISETVDSLLGRCDAPNLD
jgi:hypothetical protein